MKQLLAAALTLALVSPALAGPPDLRRGTPAGWEALFRDGIPVAIHAGGQSDFLVAMEPALEWEARQALLRKRLAPWHAQARAV